MTVKDATQIELVPFDASWHEQYQKVVLELKKIFADLPIDFHHIGSTSIPGCLAKPIIDILGITSDITKIDRFNASLERVDFEVKGEFGMKQRRYFQKKTKPAINLHIFEDSDPEVMRYFRFCDFLRKNPQEVNAYSQLKQELVKKFPYDMDSYCLGKEPFIKKIDQKAAFAATTSNYILDGAERKKEWTEEEIKQAMDANMHLLMIYFAKHVPSLDIVFEKDVTLIRSDIADDYFNMALSLRFTKENAKERLQHVINIFQEKKLPFSIEVGPLDTPDNVQELLLESGFTHVADSPGMALNIDQWQQSDLHSHPDLKFVHVQSPTALSDFSKVIVATGESPKFYEAVLSKAPPVLYQEGASLEMHLAYAGTVPVVAAIILFHANVAGIYYLSTDPSHRKKGYATSMMQHLLKRAKNKGYHLATLQATQEGYSLYKRLGFVDITIYNEFSQ